MGILDWLFGSQRDAVEQQHRAMLDPFGFQNLTYAQQHYTQQQTQGLSGYLGNPSILGLMAKQMQAMSPQQILDHNCRMALLAAGISENKCGRTLDYIWDGKIWYPF